MLEIKGKANTAVCFAKAIDDDAAAQIRRMCDCDFTAGSRIRIMPDVHAGQGCTVGTTMTISDRAAPGLVGVDIGCGMYTVRLMEADIDLARLDEAAHHIPSGRSIWQSGREDFDLTALRCFPWLKNTARLVRSLGTLGGGNHFIEVDAAADGTKYLVIHSGSRSLGKQVAEHYQRLAVEQSGGAAGLAARRDALIAGYRAAGRSGEIPAALAELYAAGPLPEELCYVSGQHLEDYLHDVQLCQRFARRNRELIASILLQRSGLKGREGFHTVHNYIDTDGMILRKGAIAAHAGERVLIPINMRDGSILAVGRGAPDWNWSAPHGAGRVMSRTEARVLLDLEEYRRQMAGVYSTSVSEATIDESPMAYKSLSDIVEVIGDTVQVQEILKPVYNFKAG